jgi:hypothetical protein
LKDATNSSNSQDFDQPQSTDGSAIAGPDGAQSKEIVYKTNGALHLPIQSSCSPGFDDSGKRVPLQYFALQTGTKIQVRMGYANNPDDLTPIFSGIVTQIEEGPVMTLTAQGFGVELIDHDPELVDQTMGGYFRINGGGEAINVMARMLESQRAKHFGHWQVDVPTNQEELLLRGWTWQKLLADTAGVFSAKAGTLIRTAADRTRENILVDHYYLPNGNMVQGFSSQDFNIERVSYVKPVQYTIPKDMSITPWMIIHDVKRRYPEFTAIVKLYGFPFGCDATLVYGAPNSFYVARPTLSNQSELSNMTNADGVEFGKWWNANRERFKRAAANLVGNLPGLAQLAAYNWAAKIDGAGANAPTAFSKAINDMSQTADFGISLLKVPTFGDNVDYGGQLHPDIVLLENTKVELRQLRIEAVMGIQFQKDPTSTFKASNRMQPVRKWILVTSENIIKNSIVLNENFYNSVRVADENFAVNAGMEKTTGNRRLLDCDKRIIEPKYNVKVISGMKNRYAQSFLREELGKMYRGELHLTGIPEIQAGDVLMLVDRSTGMTGPLEVGSVIHSFDQEMGYITIVKPNALVALNEAMTSGILDGIFQLVKNTFGELTGFSNLVEQNPGATAIGVAGVTGTVAVGKFGALAAVGQLKAVAQKSLVQKILQTGAAQFVRGAGTTVAEVATDVVATELGITTIGGAIFSAPALTLAALLAASALSVVASNRQKMNPLFLMPLNRFGRPWVAGVDGWSLNDLSSSIGQAWTALKTYDLEPYLQLVRDAAGSKGENSVPWLDRTIGVLGEG